MTEVLYIEYDRFKLSDCEHFVTKSIRVKLGALINDLIFWFDLSRTFCD